MSPGAVERAEVEPRKAIARRSSHELTAEGSAGRRRRALFEREGMEGAVVIGTADRAPVNTEHDAN